MATPNEKSPSNQDDLHIEQGPGHAADIQRISVDDKALVADAQQGAHNEHNVGVIQGLRTYKWAAFWSIAIAMSVIMEGYDVTLLSSFFGYPSFRRKYGTYIDEESGYQISVDWQNAFNILAAVANIVGALLNGWLTSKYGHRIVLMGSLSVLSACIFITFFAPNIQAMLAGMTLCNVPWGVFATTGPAYVAEVTPLAIRGYLTAYINLCWTIGQFISAGVLAGLVNNPTEWSYRVPFAVQWVWPIPLFILAYFAPESPWFLMREGRLEEAKKSLQRLSNPDHHVDYDAHLAMMIHTDKLEKEERTGVTYWDAFRGTNRRRTEIACMAFLSQITNGGALCYQGTFFYQQTGISDDASYYINLGGKGIAFLGTIISWLYIYRFGRRTIWLTGFTILTVILWTIGFLSLPRQNLPLAWGQSILCVVWLGTYSMTVGPIVYTIIAEVGSTRLRTQTVVLGRSLYQVGNIICGGTLHYRFISPTAWDVKGKVAFFWSSLATLTLIWGYFRLSETKGRTFGEMDFMFQKGISARQSTKFVINEDEIPDQDCWSENEQSNSIHHHHQHLTYLHHPAPHYLDISPLSVFSDADLLFNTSASSSSSSSTPALFPDLSTFSSAAFPPVDTTPHGPQLFYDHLLINPSMFPGDPALSTTSFEQTLAATSAAGYPGLSADDIDWAALGCLPSGPSHSPEGGLREHPVNSLASQSSADSPDPPFEPPQPTAAAAAAATTLTAPSHLTSIPITSAAASTMPSATSHPTPAPVSTSRDPSPKESPARISKRQLNTLAARRYRQRRLDRITQLEEELVAVKRERDELKMRVSKLEGETDALRGMLKEKGR
ncbi:uncharacterized protein BJX67DRAFT_378346 [Aspergillus lucknowensis]|uniref:Major facilitator superfamily (MFS) profile domain-containing protein n=1 Tax=Aspergillus lucknowensis TaxID=176173 RepID=A0ABR4M0M5_9EURO